MVVGFISIMIIFIISLIVFVISILLFGWIMIHFVRPIHDRIWGYRIARAVTLRNLIHEGIWLTILILWFSLMFSFVALGIYLIVHAIINKEIIPGLLGITLGIFFSSKIFFMFEHTERTKKRHNKKYKTNY